MAVMLLCSFIYLILFIMKKKVIDVVTLDHFGMKVDVLSVEQANVDQLMSILQLAPVDSTVQIHVHEIEIQSPFNGGFVKEENA